jgi:type IV pilus assembly protein PilY1
LTTSFGKAWVDGYAHSLPDISPDFYDLASDYQPTAGLLLNRTSTKSHEFMEHYNSDVRCQASKCQYNSTVGKSPATWVNMGASCSSNAQCARVQMPAYYYVYDGNNSGCSGTAAQRKVDNDCYDIVIVSATSGPAGTDLNGDGKIDGADALDLNGDGVTNSADKDERQNFANWYSFYRTRNLATIASASQAFAEFDASTRVAWQALNTCRNSTTSLPTSSCNGWDTNSPNVSNAIKPFTGQHKQDFYTWLFRLNTNTSTPLHEAMVRAGNYYSTTGENSPYDDDLTAAGTVTGTSGQLSCRKDFHVLMTDGIWSDTSVNVGGNLDRTLPPPYTDGNSNSLADVAYKYWSTDLTNLTNNLLPYIVETAANATDQYNNAKNDPAYWQHMVNFTVGLGLTPFLESAGLTYGGNTYSGSYPAIAAGTQTWPTTANNAATDDGRVADLWHAAIDSRGRFFSADTPDALVKAFIDVKNAIEIATPSAAALAANSTSTQVGALVYQAVFNSKDWSGDLKAYQIGFGGVVASTPDWNAASKLPAAASRNIFTINGNSGVNFSWGSLSGVQQDDLNTNASGVADANGAARLDWLRGVQGKEVKNGGIFRNRTSVLGDIINSDPAFAYADDFGYKDMAADEAASYASYVESKSGRTPTVFVGSNDGMLHAFRADSGNVASGAELFAYVPNAVYPNLSKLTDPSYSHQYYVDAGPTVGDACLGGPPCAWRTVLVGGLGAGGSSVYALNVSNVTSPSAAMVMWEFTDPDMGLSYSKPQIARLNDGQWVAVFGNGYNSSSERAYLYVVNLETGALIKKIAAGSATANGLSTPVLYDANNDMIMDYAYAGDLQGNLWRFDLTGFADETTPLFTARNASNQVQAITTQPILGGHPNGGALVYFGTGQYLQASDTLNTNVQTFYGIWDKNWTDGVPEPITTTIVRSDLQQQSIVAATTEFGKDLRETTANTVNWSTKLGWYMDFNQSAGERVLSHALLRYGRVVFVTVVPSTDTCDAGGGSWIMDLDAVTGARATGSNYDFNNDKSYDESDNLASGAAASGFKTTVGISKTPAWFEGVDIEGNKTGTDYMVWTGTLGGTESIGTKAPGPAPGPGGGGALRRVYWLQIQ